MSAATVSGLLRIARSQLGYREKDSDKNLDDPTANAGDGNHTKYARDLSKAGYYNGNKNGYAWCDVFVDWCFWTLCDKDSKKAQAMICQTGPLGAGCRYSARYYRNAGRFYSNPMPGDQVFFGNSGSETHTGIVEEVHQDSIVTIEGNSSNKVARRTYRRDNVMISGYGRPHYDPEEADKPQGTVKDIVHIVKPGETLTGIAREHKIDVDLLIKYNQLPNPNLIYTNQRIWIPVVTPAQPVQDKTLDEVAREVIRGKWGNGTDRKARLTAAGYDFEEVQKRVNTILG